ncbi:MAG: cryptochrome/photolyase family protein [Planctomycetota bacterium]
MSRFSQQLRSTNPDPAGRKWIYVPYDQLSDRIGPLSRTPPQRAGIVLVEAPAKAARRPYHRQKLALILANQRHFALKQAKRGVAVRYLVSAGSYADALRDLGPLVAMRPAERELRVELDTLENLEQVPHEGWLTTTEQFEQACGDPPWRMDAFYRRVRRATGLLMQDGKPEGGRFSFDTDNRETWPGHPPAPAPLQFPRDAIKEEVAALIEREYADHPGRVDLDSLPATAGDAAALWAWALEHCLPLFGPYEDAMSTKSRSLFHTRISALLHLHRLLPRDVVKDVAALDVPIASREGFVRQVLGWREFVRHVHEVTDGFRRVQTDHLGAGEPLPEAFWGRRPSGLACLDTVVREVWEDGYSHHITRLMVLSNIATLLDVSPRELADWFWVAYTDAFDWVVEPNVLGMGTFAAGGLMTTKPYVSGARYIDKMGDYCASCAFDPKRDCPITRLYWAFLARHEERLEDNPRMRLILASLARRSKARRLEDASVFECVRTTLAKGAALQP